MTLTEFLLARIAEDEKVALEAVERECRVGGGDHGKWCHSLGGQIRFAGGAVAFVPEPWAGHIARHDPARVLAECEAKRRIVELHDWDRPWCDGGYIQSATHARVREAAHLNGVPCGELCPTLRALALPYADHPDYREEWKP